MNAEALYKPTCCWPGVMKHYLGLDYGNSPSRENYASKAIVHVYILMGSLTQYALVIIQF